MKLVPLSELFDIKYGVDLELNKMTFDDDGVPFVSRTSNNNGVSAYVSQIPGIDPNPKDTISVACGGSVMASFLQKKPYYSGRDVFVLSPVTEMSDDQKLYYCKCLEENAYRFNYGRQANRTLKHLMVPEYVPSFVNVDNVRKYVLQVVSKVRSFSVDSSFQTEQSAKNVDNVIDIHSRNELVPLNELFKVEHGDKLDLNKMIINFSSLDSVAFVGRSDENNGISAFVGRMLGIEPHEAGLITVALGGSVLASFVQVLPFYTAQNVDILTPKASMSLDVKLFYCRCIEENRFRYSTFGREANRTLSRLLVPSIDSVPSWVRGTNNSAIAEICNELTELDMLRDDLLSEFSNFANSTSKLLQTPKSKI